MKTNFVSARRVINRQPWIRSALAAPLAARRAWLDWRRSSGRQVWRRLAQAACEDLVLEVPAFDGRFALDPRSHVLLRLLLEGEYESDLARVFFGYVEPASDVVDVGANVGFFTVGAARRLTTGRLLAIEPTPGAFRRLSANVIRNQVAERVILRHAMAGSAEGTGTIRYIPGLEEYSGARAPQHPALAAGEFEVQCENVPMETLDCLVERFNLRPSLIKIDVEGAEAQVLAGAQATLSRFRPVVIAELWQLGFEQHAARDVLARFAQLNYVVMDPLDTRFAPLPTPTADILCVPRERLAGRGAEL